MTALFSNQEQAKGTAIRLALMSVHYRKPLNWTDKLYSDARLSLNRMHRALSVHYPDYRIPPGLSPDGEVLAALCDDLNTPKALARIHELTKQANKGDPQAAASLAGSMNLLGLLLSEDKIAPSSSLSRPPVAVPP